jgi:long-chain acyl-CoA synthetase
MNGDLSWSLVRASRLRPDAPGIVDGSRVVTYAELARRVGALGGALDLLGVGRGARVGILASNSLAHVECFIGVPSFGRVVVSLNVRLAEEELAFIVDDAEIAALITDAEHLPVARALADRCSSLVNVVVAGEQSAPTDCVSYEGLIEASPVLALGGAESGLAAVSYTGGTTGRPKGVMLTHDNLLANARHSLIAVGHTSSDRWLHVCPLFHVAGTANLLAATWVGATQVVLPRFDAEAVLRTIEEQRITHTMLVPTMLRLLLDHPARAAADLSSLRHLEYSASPIGRELQRRVLEALPCNVAQFYGMTEAPSAVTQLSPRDHRRGQAGEEPFRTRLRSTGTAVVGVQVEVRDDEGTARPPGEVGEVWVRGPNVMLGYWRRPDATDAALIDGWYRTGDAAYADREGYLFLVDRLKEMIITGGENVYSAEVEAALLDHPAVLEAAVIGIPDERWGEAVHAVVTVRPGTAVDGEELIAHCRRLIAGFKLPRSVDVRDEPLPRSAAGKTLKNQLREPYWAGHDRAIG